MTNESYVTDLHIPETYRGQRIDRVLSDLLDEVSRSQIHAWIIDGSIKVDGVKTKPSSRVHGNEHVVVDGRIPQAMQWDSEQSVQFKVVYEDEDILVIDKPAGLVVHPGSGNPDGTLVNGLIAHRHSLTELPRAGLVHRLDKDTSGLLVVAASHRASVNLVSALSSHRVKRNYSCIHEGRIEYSRHVDLPIGRHVVHRTRQQVRDDGRYSVTDFVPREVFRAHTYSIARLQTGRTHQIRVHAEAINFPLVGDVTYGARGRLPRTPSQSLVETINKFNRQALHANELEFDHPTTGEQMCFRAALPEDMKLLLKALREDEDIL